MCRSLVILFVTCCWGLTHGFTQQGNPQRSFSSLLGRSSPRIHPSPTSSSTTSLFAKSKKKKSRATRNTVRNRTKSATGFGGAALESCPCGSTLPYSKCCHILHSDETAFSLAKPEAIVRARYSAYAKREVNFIIGSTHPLNKDFQTDIEHWKKTIRTNCYDNFELKSCTILEESLSDAIDESGNPDSAQVKFIATMTQVDSREKTAFMETSTFERAGKHIRQGAWLYRSGDVEPVNIVEGVDEDKMEKDGIENAIDAAIQAVETD